MPAVYIVRCADGTFYTGYAVDVARRCEAHNAGRGAKYTASRLPVTLVYEECCESASAALKREYALKQLTRVQKQMLIARARRKKRRVPASPA
ncbi:MAG: GIY-YIG nuclease family protein [Acidobacteriota bacterium]|nr:GIY-YIG nuclease family protein [Acidobacteriota bacterium]